MAEPQKASLLARICCCSREEKEPTVTLIRTNDLANAPKSSISPAKNSVDGFQDQTLEVPTAEGGPKEVFRGAAPKWKGENKDGGGTAVLGKDTEMNMNDVIMEDVCGEVTDKPNVEDAISIRTNVVEEVDEAELRKISEEVLTKDEGLQETSRSGEMVTLQQMLVDGYQTPRIEGKNKPALEIEVTTAEEEATKTVTIQDTPRSMDDEDSELEEEVVVHETRSTAPTASPRSILKTSSSNPSTGRTEDSEESFPKPADSPLPPLLTPPPPPLSPPPENEILEGLHHAVLVNVEDEPKKANSVMYADADLGSDSSDDEAEREVLPPVAKPEDDKVDLSETDEENWEEKDGKENKVTRLSLKSNGQATMTTGNVRVALEAVDITDDEFSEKLI